MYIHLKKFVSIAVLGTFLWLVAFSCVPKDEVVFKGVKNIVVEANQQGEPLLKADALFYNPNKVKMKLKEVFADVLVNGKPSAQVRQKLSVSIPAESDFSVPVAAQLSLKELGLLDTIVNLLGGKKYEIQYSGYVRIAVHGVTIKVPFTYKEQLRLRL
jgi:LEA14-like dessication related protein